MAKSLGPAPKANLFVDFDASSFDAIREVFGPRFDDVAGEIIADHMQKGAQVIQRAVVKSARRHRRTGKLERGIRILTASGDGFARSLRVKSTGPIAHLVAGPVRPHHIVVGLGERALPYNIGTIIGFAHSVERGGTRGDPYFKRGVSNARLAVHNVMLAAGRRLTEHLAELIAAEA